MMARLERRNGTALSRRRKLGGEDNRKQEENVGSCCFKRKRRVRLREEVSCSRASMPVTKFFRCAWYSEYVVLLQKSFRKGENAGRDEGNLTF
jgi:hypothetical protein